MTTLSHLLLDKEILLESGTNELELLVFDVADYTFGINVAKVREVLPAAAITRLPRAHGSIRGVFKLRDNVIPCVSLLDHLGIAPKGENRESTMILTDFNQQQTAFLVDAVERIHRLSWEHILSVPGLEALAHTPVTALARCDERLIVMLDFEMILDDVTERYFRTDSVENPLGLPRERLRILLAEDSPTVREAIGATLRNSGYTQLTFFENGAQAWRWLCEQLEATGRAEGVADLVISDVEMPQVDGFHLTKRIKDHPQLKHLPVLLYSSIITPDNAKKGKAVGCDAQVSKPELKKVVQLADELISTAQREHRAAAMRELSAVVESSRGQASAPSAPAQTLGASAKPPEAHIPASEPAPGALPSGAEPTASLAPNEPVECAGCPTAPRGVGDHLWATFHSELTGHVGELRALLAAARAGRLDETLLRRLARSLHTIKSASMVVPLNAVAQCTHLVESLVENVRQSAANWPEELLENYVAWLGRILCPPGDVDEVLAEGDALAARLRS